MERQLMVNPTIQRWCRRKTYWNVRVVHDVSTTETIGLVGEDVVHQRVVPDRLGDSRSVLTSKLADVLRLVSCVEDIRQMCELDGQHRVRRGQER